MLIRILDAQLVREDMWMVWFKGDEKDKFPMARLVPVGEPKVCPGGAWCKDFNCEENLKKFREAELVNIGESKGMSLNLEETAFEFCECEEGCDNCLELE